MFRIQTRSRSRPDAGKSPSRHLPSGPNSPAGSLEIYEKNIPVRSSAKQVRVSVARLEMPKVDSTRKTGKTKELEMVKNGSSEATARRSIRSMPNESTAKQENGMAKPTSANKAAPARTYSNGHGLSSKERSKTRTDSSRNTPKEWGGWFGALLFISLIPIVLLFIQLACMNDHCAMENFRVPRLSELALFLDRNAFLLYAGYLLFITIMSVLPIGRIVAGQQSKSGTLEYRINGLYTLILVASIMAGCVYKGYEIDGFLIENSLQLTVAGLVYGLILSIVLYTRAPLSNLNSYGSTNSSIYNFWQGREINPRFGPIDVKQALFESTVILTNLINLAAVIRIFKEADGSFNWSELNVAALVVISLQFVFFVDKLVSEAKFLSSFEMTYEGMGYMLSVGYLAYPYVSTLSTRYLLVHKVQLPMYLTVFWIIVFFVGFYLYRASNNQKDAFRKNPFSPSLSHLETIPTPAGKRLLVSGFWGYVRRPNYLGDIMMHLAWAFLGFAPDVMPYVLAIATTVLLVHRVIRDEARCAKRYRFAWKQYCDRVKYVILPPIF